MRKRATLFCGALFLVAATSLVALSDPAKPPAPPAGGKGKAADDLELVHKLNMARVQYREALEDLRAFYIKNGDTERTGWVEDELKQHHRTMKYSYRQDVDDVPPEILQPKENSKDANTLIIEALKYKDKGFGTEYTDNQRRAELLLQRLLTKYPECDKIGEAAYLLGEIYEKYKPTPQYRRAAVYFERAVIWSKSYPDSRMRAAHLYDKNLNERDKAKTLYKEVLTHDTDQKRVDEAKKRLDELK